MYADVSFANFADQALGLTWAVCESSHGRTPFYDSLFVTETCPLLDGSSYISDRLIRVIVIIALTHDVSHSIGSARVVHTHPATLSFSAKQGRRAG